MSSQLYKILDIFNDNFKWLTADVKSLYENQNRVFWIVNDLIKILSDVSLTNLFYKIDNVLDSLIDITDIEIQSQV